MLRIVLALLVLCSLASAQVGKDVVKATKTIRGTFMSFEMGDYLHATIKDAKGKEHSYFVGADGLEFFLAANWKKTGTFTYQVVDTHIPEAGGRMVIERLSSAKFGRTSFATWWTAVRRKMKRAAIFEKYQPMVERATAKEGSRVEGLKGRGSRDRESRVIGGQSSWI